MYSQDQINAICASYSDEVVKLLEIKASQVLTIQELRRKVIEKDKEIEKLNGLVAKANMNEDNQKKEEVTVPSNGTTETINSMP